jgi:hypothetical protein
MIPLELPPPCSLCNGNGRRAELTFDGRTVWYGRCPACEGRGYTGPRRDLSTPVLAWAESVGFAWPAASSVVPRGLLRRGALALPVDAMAGSLDVPSSSGSTQADDAVA